MHLKTKKPIAEHTAVSIQKILIINIVINIGPALQTIYIKGRPPLFMISYSAPPTVAKLLNRSSAGFGIL